MYINNQNFYTANLKYYQNIRDYMVLNMYPRPGVVDEIINLISSKIDCLDISFDSMRYEINIAIKKTTMRRAKGYKASTMYYYGIMNSVFRDFFTNHPEYFTHMKLNVNGIGEDSIINFDNICQVNCIGDKYVTIKL